VLNLLKAIQLRLMQPQLLKLRTAIALLVMIHVGAIALLSQMQFNNAPELYIPHDTPAAQLDRELRKEFPSDESLIGLFTGDTLLKGADIYTEEFLAALDRVAVRMEKHPLVDRVFSVTTMDRITGSEDGFSIEKLIDREALKNATPEERRKRILSDRFAPGLLISEDASVLAIVIRPKVLDNSQERAVIEAAFRAAVKAEQLDRYMIAVAGTVPLDVAELNSMIQDSIMFTPLVVLLGLQLLLWVVGRFPPIIIGAVAISTVVVSTLAMVSAIGQPYTLVTAMLPTLLSAYTVANLLHIYSALLRMRKAGLRRPMRVIFALQEVHKPTLYNVLSTSAGMLSVILIPIPPVQVFGLMGAFGVLMIYVTLFYLIPPLLVRWDRGPWPRGGSGFAWTRRISYGLASFSMRHAGWVVGVIVIAFAVGLPQILKVQAETDLHKFFDVEHPITRSTNIIESRLVGVTSLEIVIDGPARDSLKDVERLRAIKAVQNWIDQQPEVDRSSSMMDFIEEMNWAFHGEDEAFRSLPNNNKLLSQLLLIYDGNDLEEVVNREYQRTRIMLSLNVHGANEIEKVIERIRSHVAAEKSHGLRWDIAGYGRLLSDQEDLLVPGQVKSFASAFIQIFLIMLLLWRSIPIAVIGMLPNLAPLFFVFVLMGATSIYLDMATVLIASVVLGITVDDTIHFFHNFTERRRKGCGVVFSLARSFDASGRAVVAISVLLVVQFMLLAGSRFEPTSNFGLLAATGLLSGQLLELLMLPALVVLWSKIKTKPPFMSV
jgi:predicted RND superfamily exporter protein